MPGRRRAWRGRVALQVGRERDDPGLRADHGERSKAFFFGKKNQKTFVHLRPFFLGARVQMNEVFLLLFLQKKKILSYSGSGNWV